jgi:hypothetical protein
LPSFFSFFLQFFCFFHFSFRRSHPVFGSSILINARAPFSLSIVIHDRTTYFSSSKRTLFAVFDIFTRVQRRHGGVLIPLVANSLVNRVFTPGGRFVNVKDRLTNCYSSSNDRVIRPIAC